MIIFTAQHIILFLSCKILNLISTSIPRNTASKSMLIWSNPPCIIAVNHIIYFFVCKCLLSFVYDPLYVPHLTALWSQWRHCVSQSIPSSIKTFFNDSQYSKFKFLWQSLYWVFWRLRQDICKFFSEMWKLHIFRDLSRFSTSVDSNQIPLDLSLDALPLGHCYEVDISGEI